MSLGDFDTSAVIYGKFSTYRPSTGASFTLGGTPALSVYKDNSVTQSTTGVTLTADFDSVTGLNHFAIDTSADGAFYTAGSFFDIVITTGTVDSVSVTGSVVASFTLRKDSSLKPTVAARTLDVSAGGEAGLDWANIGSPTTAQNLSATNIDVDQVVASVSGAVGSVTGNVGGNVTGSVGTVNALAANVITAAATAADFTTEIQTGLATAANLATVDGNVTTILADTNDMQTRLPAALVGGRMDSSVGAMAANVMTAAATAADYVTELQAGLSTLTAAAAADAVWDEILAGHLGVGSTGEALNAAGAGGDPWTTALPGAYGAGSAGNIVGNNLNAPVGTVDTVVDAIKAKTDSLTFTVANKVDSNIKSVNDVTVNGVGTAGNPWSP